MRIKLHRLDAVICKAVGSRKTKILLISDNKNIPISCDVGRRQSQCKTNVPLCLCHSFVISFTTTSTVAASQELHRGISQHGKPLF